jgi:hypothetical protein
LRCRGPKRKRSAAKGHSSVAARIAAKTDRIQSSAGLGRRSALQTEAPVDEDQPDDDEDQGEEHKRAHFVHGHSAPQPDEQHSRDRRQGEQTMEEAKTASSVILSSPLSIAAIVKAFIMRNIRAVIPSVVRKICLNGTPLITGEAAFV